MRRTLEFVTANNELRAPHKLPAPTTASLVFRFINGQHPDVHANLSGARVPPGRPGWMGGFGRPQGTVTPEQVPAQHERVLCTTTRVRVGGRKTKDRLHAQICKQRCTRIARASQLEPKCNKVQESIACAGRWNL